MINFFFTKKEYIFHASDFATKDGSDISFSGKLTQVNGIGEITLRDKLPFKEGQFFLKIQKNPQGDIKREDMKVVHKEKLDKEIKDRSLNFFLLIAQVNRNEITNYFQSKINYYRSDGEPFFYKDGENYCYFLEQTRKFEHKTNTTDVLEQKLLTKFSGLPALKYKKSRELYSYDEVSLEVRIKKEIAEIFTKEEEEEEIDGNRYISDDVLTTTFESNLGLYDKNILVYLQYVEIFPIIESISTTRTEEQINAFLKDVYGGELEPSDFL